MIIIIGIVIVIVLAIVTPTWPADSREKGARKSYRDRLDLH